MHFIRSKARRGGRKLNVQFDEAELETSDRYSSK